MAVNLQALASHTIDLDLLPEEPIVLDVGCRWFDFTRGILALRPKAEIVCVDPSSDIKWNELDLLWNCRVDCALVGDDREMTNFAEGIAGDGGGNHVIDGDRDGDYRIRQVRCVTINDVMAMYGIRHFDAVKLDCEGSEFGILENWPGPIATQISVEFHDWSGPWKQHGCSAAIANLERFGYKTVQHELSRQGNGIGHWDSLFVLGK
jgi:FkbM family methyltransferase